MQGGSFQISSCWVPLYLASKVCGIFSDRILALETGPFTVQLALNTLWSWGWLWTLDLSASISKGTHTIIPSFMCFNLCISVCEYTYEYVLADTCRDPKRACGFGPLMLEVQVVVSHHCGCWELNLDSLQEQPALLPWSCCPSLYFSNC